MSLRLRVLITKVLYGKHFYGRSLAEFNNVEIDTKCKLCGAVGEGEQQHILRERSDPAMVRGRRRQKIARHRKVCVAEMKRDPMTRFLRGYNNFAAERRLDPHEFWIGVLF